MRTFIVSLIIVLIACAQPASALRQVRVYEVTVSSQTDAAVQAQAGLRQVLVRATGERDAANNPALATVLSQAPQYVLATRPSANGRATQIVFDAAALERDIVAAGGTIWAAERPLVVIILTGGPASGQFETRRQVEGALDTAANRRGLPIRVARPEALGLPAEGDISTDAALLAAQRLGADAVLVGYGDAVANGGTWHWILSSSSVSESWNGALEEAVQASADVFARNSMAYSAMPELALLVEIDGVPTLKEFARVTDLLGGAGGVRGVQLAEAAGARASFTVTTRSSVDALQGSLAATGHFDRIDPKAGGTLAFRYRQ